MASTSFTCSQILSFDPCTRSRIIKSNSNRKMFTSVRATNREGHDQDFSGRLVDENLIILRKRIHEMAMIESNYEAPKEWMEWEKRFYATNYDSAICDAMGHLQSYLMESRPSLTLGMVVLIALSVPTSTALLLYNLLVFIKPIVAGS